VQLLKCQKYSHISNPKNALKVICIFMAFLTLGGCASFVSVDQKFGKAPIPKGVHVVQKSETLFSLAWRYGWDYKALASANSIKPPYTIFPNQTLTITHKDIHKTNVPSKPPKTLTKSKRPTSTKGPSAYKTRPAPPTVGNKGHALAWRWPSKGKVIANFSSKSPVNKGIDITGRIGESVMAAATGSVVYAGSGLLGYGNLVIIKHNDTFLSAYAHNKKLLVKEGQKVKAGQVIAEIGSSGTDKVKLHFEIRRQGKPVNPKKYLPKVK
jgi:lipoprotein NlpD